MKESKTGKETEKILRERDKQSNTHTKKKPIKNIHKETGMKV